MEEKRSEKKRKRSEKNEPKARKRRRMIKEGAFNEDKMWERLDEKIARSEQRDIEDEEKKQRENLKKYEQHLSKTPSTTGSYEITYVRDTRRERAMSLPISKDLMVNAYGKAMSTGLKPTVFHIRAPSEEGDFSQNFVIRKGHDYVLFPLVPEKTGGGFKQEGRDGPRFVDLALKADEAAEWLRVQQSEKFSTITLARVRVARDINRMAGGKRPQILYPLKFLVGGSGLASFAAVIRADKGRVSKATKYIESILKNGDTTFGVRFGGDRPTYIGTGTGTGRGPEGLRQKGEEVPGEDSEYSDDEPQ
ncbi:MAG TPA: hypothetical protein VF789_11745 [Thermoanaerobaculia bacterium]